MHKPIRPFQLEGEFIDDSHALLTRVKAERHIDHMMREKGYVRCLDLDTAWHVSYDSLQNSWSFVIIGYGVYVGKRKSWQYEGITQGKLIPRSTRQIMSKP